MTEHERRAFCNLLARGRGLAPVYDEDALAEAEARDRATEQDSNKVGRVTTPRQPGPTPAA